MAKFELDHAMRIYLGGESDTAIEVGGGLRRLEEVFGDECLDIQAKLDDVLAAIRRRSPNGFVPGGRNGVAVESWLASQMPEFSKVSRSKIAAHVLYYAIQ